MDSRKAWDELRRRFKKIEPEFLRGLNELVGRFNVTDRANRFIVGGVVEYLLAASFFALDIFVIPRGANQDAFDLDSLVGELRTRFSIKSTFSAGGGDIRLMNRLSGGTDWLWDEPTIFVIHGLGMVYVDPVVHTKIAGKTRDVGDAFVISMRAIHEHASSNPDCVINCDIPINPRTGTESGSRALFREIFDHPAYPTIGGLLKRAQLNIQGADIMEYIDEVNARRDRNDISANQAAALIDAFIAKLQQSSRPSR